MELPAISAELPANSAELPGLSIGYKYAQPMKTPFRQNWKLSAILDVFGRNFRIRRFLCWNVISAEVPKKDSPGIFQLKISGLSWSLQVLVEFKAPDDPPPTSFRSRKKYVGGLVYFTWSGEIFLRNFLPYPPKYSRVKGGGILAPCGVQDCYIVIQTIQSTFMRGAGSAVLLFCHRPNWVQYHGGEKADSAIFSSTSLCDCLNTEAVSSRSAQADLWLSRFLTHISASARRVTVICVTKTHLTRLDS